MKKTYLLLALAIFGGQSIRAEDLYDPSTDISGGPVGQNGGDHTSPNNGDAGEASETGGGEKHHPPSDADDLGKKCVRASLMEGIDVNGKKLNGTRLAAALFPLGFGEDYNMANPGEGPNCTDFSRAAMEFFRSLGGKARQIVVKGDANPTEPGHAIAQACFEKKTGGPTKEEEETLRGSTGEEKKTADPGRTGTPESGSHEENPECALVDYGKVHETSSRVNEETLPAALTEQMRRAFRQRDVSIHQDGKTLEQKYQTPERGEQKLSGNLNFSVGDFRGRKNMVPALTNAIKAVSNALKELCNGGKDKMKEAFIRLASLAKDTQHLALGKKENRCAHAKKESRLCQLLASLGKDDSKDSGASLVQELSGNPSR